MGQIDLVNGRSTPRMFFDWAIKRQESSSWVNRSAQFTNNWTITHDSNRGTSTASLEVGVPFTLPNARVDFQVYGGWSGTGLPLCYQGILTNEAQRYWIQGEQFSITGYSKLVTEPLGRNKCFYYNGGTTDETNALLALIPDGWQAVPILTDADIIIHILESYNITPSTSNHSIEASDIEVARLMPIGLSGASSGWSLIQELDKLTRWRTYDGRFGEIKRRQLYGNTPGSPVHTFTQGIDIIDVQRSLVFQPYNQVKVFGAFNESLSDYTYAQTPVSDLDIVSNPWIHDPPKVRVFEIRSELIETVPIAQTIADQWYPIVNTPFEEFQLVTFACSDIDVGDSIGIDCHLITSNCWVTAHTIDNARRLSTFTCRAFSV